MSGHLTSHGRGGAGNMADSSKSPKLQAVDLQTPVLRTSVVTTGRGGSGNMAKNTDAAETRLRQDVEPVVRRLSQGAVHAGRGGAGNIFRAGEVNEDSNASAVESPRQSTDSAASKPHQHHQHHEPQQSLANKGKEWLLGKK